MPTKTTQLKHTNSLQNWFEVKSSIGRNNPKPPMVKEGEIWWCRVGENIGTEINGKGDNFTRPVLIQTKLSNKNFLIIPISTQIKQGSWFVKFKHNEVDQIAILSQIKIIDYRRLKNKIGQLDKQIFDNINSQMLQLFLQK
jgi:mRNA interferase MazF